MEILPLDHKPTDGIDWQTPEKFRPTLVMGWLRNGDKEFGLIWSPHTQMWLIGDGNGPALPLPLSDQYRVTELMTPNLRAVELASAKKRS